MWRVFPAAMLLILSTLAQADPGYDDSTVRARAAELAVYASRYFTHVLKAGCDPSTDEAFSAVKAQACWQRELVTHVATSKRYPAEARAQNIQGNVLLQFTVSRAGQLVEAHVVQSSGSTLLDAEALAILQRALPLPPPPPETPGDSFVFRLPIHFKIPLTPAPEHRDRDDAADEMAGPG
jgi:TonB family protein